MTFKKKMPLRIQSYLTQKRNNSFLRHLPTASIKNPKPDDIFYGQHQEDVFIKSLFAENYIGVCVDVGAYDGVNMSNTYYFEKKGWRCLCIEPIIEEYEKCKTIRKECVNCCAGHEDKTEQNFVVFSLGSNTSAISSLSPDPKLICAHKNLITSEKERKVQVCTLTTLLDDHNFPINIDFVSIDTEGTELDVLQGIDFEKYNIFLFVIENNFEDQSCENFLKKYGYCKINRIAVNDFFIKKNI